MYFYDITHSTFQHLIIFLSLWYNWKTQDWANRHAAHHNRHSPDTSGDARRNSPSSHGHRRNSPTHHARVSRGVSAPSLRPTLIPTPPLPGGDSGLCGDDGDLSPQPLGSGSGGTANSLSKSRRRLPPTPGIQGWRGHWAVYYTSPQSLIFLLILQLWRLWVECPIVSATNWNIQG